MPTEGKYVAYWTANGGDFEKLEDTISDSRLECIRKIRDNVTNAQNGRFVVVKELCWVATETVPAKTKVVECSPL